MAMEESKSELQAEVTDKYSLRGRVFNRLREDILSAVICTHAQRAQRPSRYDRIW